MDMTAHGGMITGPGCPTVLIGKMPAAQIGNMHMCPMVTPGTPPIPHVGGPITGPVPPTVLIGKMPAACAGDMAICVGPPSSVLPPGCPTVLLGQSGAGGGGGGGGGASSASGASGGGAGSAGTVEGLETAPIEIQQQMAEVAKYLSPKELKAQIELINAALSESQGADKTTEEEVQLTIADIVEILKAIESDEGFNAARFFASHLDYSTLTEMARRFVSGEDTDEKNDPNQMPTRFMLLYGMEDSKLKEEDDHPDRFEDEEHKINIANLRKGLRLLGHDIAETGPYDDEVMAAHAQYMASAPLGEYNEDELTEDSAAKDYLGKTISEICPNGFHDADHNHCAHFVSHVKGFTLGYKCRNQTGKGPKPGASIRVHEIFAECPKVGKWSDKPADVKSCLAFVISSKNVDVASKKMTNVPKKHVGIFEDNEIYHYSNTRDKVVKQTPADFKKHYSGSDIEVYYGTFPQ